MKLKSTKPKFILRHIKISDLQGYWECQQDPKTQKGFMNTPKNLAEARKELKGKVTDLKKKKPFGESFAIEINGEFVGYIELCHLNKKHEEHKGSISYCTHPEFRGRGIMVKAIKLLTEYAFKKYKLKRIWAQCKTFNKASARVLEKAGYKLEGIKRKDLCKNKIYYDNMIWARVR
jgi:RimJ/RimL family protein N-acetyltransferase